MTNGSSQGIFVIVSLVIFGIFILISYMLYQDKMKTGLTAIMCDTLTITSKNTGFNIADACDVQQNTDENLESSDPNFEGYYLIQEANLEENKQEVWVFIEPDLENNGLKIVDSGTHTGFERGLNGLGLLGNIVFPDMIENTPITQIAPNAMQQAKFENIMSLPKDLLVLDDYSLQQSVFTGETTFPENLEIIGIEALRDSRFIGGINSLYNIEKIKENAFQNSTFGDSDLSGLGKNSKGVELENGALGNYAPEGTFVFPEKLEKFGSAREVELPIDIIPVFDTSKITKIDFSKSTNLIEIGDDAFADAEITGELKLPKTVQAIGNNAFEQSELDKLDLSENTNLTKIGNNAFRNSRLTGILMLPDSIKVIGQRAFYSSIFTNLNWTPPTELEYIGEYAFYNSEMARNFDARNSKNLKYIGDYAFYNSYAKAIVKTTHYSTTRTTIVSYTPIQQIFLPDSIEYIGTSAFEQALFREGIAKLPESLKYVGDFAFKNSFRNFYAKQVFEEIEKKATGNWYRYKSKLSNQEEFMFNKNIEYIGKGAFEQATFTYNEEIIPYKLKEIGTDAFKYAFATESKDFTYTVVNSVHIDNKVRAKLPDETEYHYQTIKLSKSTLHNLENVEIVD